MTRLVVCCDGTWNQPDQVSPTNVSKLALGLAAVGADGVEQASTTAVWAPHAHSD